MSEIIERLSRLRRPRLLMRAVRIGMPDYRRERDLARLIPSGTSATPEVTLTRLMHEEARLETIRRTGDIRYSISRHIEVLIAMMTEMRLVPQVRRD